MSAADEDPRYLPAEPAQPPATADILPPVDMLKLTAKEAELVRGSVGGNHPVANFLNRVPLDQLGPRTTAFKKVAAAAKAQTDATRAVRKLEESEGRIERMDTLRARVAELESDNYALLQENNQLRKQIADLQDLWKGNPL